MKNRVKTFKQILNTYDRIGIVGGPGTGKTWLANKSKDRLIVRTDDYIDLPWKEVPAEVIKICKDRERFLVEGVQVARCLRKGMDLDALVITTKAKKELNTKQLALWKGVLTVLSSFEITIPTYIEEGEDKFVNYTGLQKQLREEHFLQQIRPDSS